jgi:hypothetical protein
MNQTAIPTPPLFILWQSLIYFLSLWISQISHVREIIYLCFGECLILLNIMSSNFIYCIIYTRVSLKTNNPCVYMPHFIYPFFHCYTFGLLYLLTIVNSVAVDMAVKITFWDFAVNIFCVYTQKWNSTPHSIFVFKFLKDKPTIFRKQILYIAFYILYVCN